MTTIGIQNGLTMKTGTLEESQYQQASKQMCPWDNSQVLGGKSQTPVEEHDKKDF